MLPATHDDILKLGLAIGMITGGNICLAFVVTSKLSAILRQLDALTRRLTQYEAADDGGI